MNSLESRILSLAIAGGFAKKGMICNRVGEKAIYVIATPDGKSAYGSYEGGMYAIDCGKGIFSIHEVLDQMGYCGDALGTIDITLSVEYAKQIDWSPEGLQESISGLHVNTVIELFKIAVDNNLIYRGIPSTSVNSVYMLPIICADGIVIFEVTKDWMDVDEDPNNSIPVEAISRISHYVIGNVNLLRDEDNS